MSKQVWDPQSGEPTLRLLSKLSCSDEEADVPSLRELQRTLSSQKRDLRAAQAKEDEKSARRLRRAFAKADGERLQLASCSAPALGLEKSPFLATSPSHSFSKLPHRTGKMGIPVCGPRDMDHAEGKRGAGFRLPAVGQYNHPSPDGLRDARAAQGPTGGWPARWHEVFRQSWQESGNEATPEFFKLMARRMPEVEPWRVCDHARWYALRERQEARKTRRIVKWREEQVNGVDPAVVSASELKERAKEAERLAWLLRCVDEYEEQIDSRRPREVLMQNQQRSPEKEVLDADLAGHPQFRKSPSHTFGSSRDPRDHTAKRFTDSAHVRSSSSLDSPGPGRYCGPEEKIGLMCTAPGYSLRMRVGVDDEDKTCPDAGPGYLGPLLGPGGKVAWRRAQLDLQATQLTKPAWRFRKEAQRFEKASSASTALTDNRTPDNVGPGSYLGR